MFEQCIYFNSNALVRHLNKIWDEAYKPTGLSAPHAYLLRLVCHEPGITQKQAGKHLHLEKSTVTRFVDALEQKGLLLRYEGDTGREIQLQASPEGKKLGKKLDEIGKQLYKRMRKQIGSYGFDDVVTAMRNGIGKVESV